MHLCTPALPLLNGKEVGARGHDGWRAAWASRRFTELCRIPDTFSHSFSGRMLGMPPPACAAAAAKGHSPRRPVHSLLAWLLRAFRTTARSTSWPVWSGRPTPIWRPPPAGWSGSAPPPPARPPSATPSPPPSRSQPVTSGPPASRPPRPASGWTTSCAATRPRPCAPSPSPSSRAPKTRRRLACQQQPLRLSQGKARVSSMHSLQCPPGTEMEAQVHLAPSNPPKGGAAHWRMGPCLGGVGRVGFGR